MAAHLRHRVSKEQRMNLTLELYLRGKSFRQIADEIGCARMTVQRDIAEIREDWRKARVDEIGNEQLMELARIDAIERESWAQWESSKKEEVISRAETEVIIETLPDGRVVRKPGKERVVRTTRIKNADPRYMDTVCWYIEQRCKLLGLLAPTKVTATNLSGTGPAEPPKVAIDLSTLSDEELVALDKLRDRMLGIMPGTGNSVN